MKKRNTNALLPIMLGASFIISLMMGITSNATENPFGSTLLNTGYVVADGHKHTEQSNQKQKECNPDKGQNCNPSAEIKDSEDGGKQKECNPDKGQNCNPPAW